MTHCLTNKDRGLHINQCFDQFVQENYEEAFHCIPSDGRCIWTRGGRDCKWGEQGRKWRQAKETEASSTRFIQEKRLWMDFFYFKVSPSTWHQQLLLPHLRRPPIQKSNFESGEAQKTLDRCHDTVAVKVQVPCISKSHSPQHDVVAGWRYQHRSFERLLLPNSTQKPWFHWLLHLWLGFYDLCPRL